VGVRIQRGDVNGGAGKPGRNVRIGVSGGSATQLDQFIGWVMPLTGLGGQQLEADGNFISFGQTAEHKRPVE